jgi:outer membrane protein
MRPKILLTGAAMLLGTTPALADTLQEALAKAYGSNPTLAAARADVRATDENVPIARAAGRPDAAVNGSYTENFLNSPGIQNSFSAPERQVVGQINVTVPLLTFGAVRGAVRAAEGRSAAARYNLRGVEADLFTSVVSAYMDVIRDDAIVALNTENVRVLETTLKANNDRFRVGDASPTDVAQSRARLSLARAQLQTAQGRLISSRETYVRLVGNAPGTLAPPPQLPNLPASLDAAIEMALRDNPNLLAAQRSRDATAGDVQAARAATAPRINGVLGGNYYDYLGSLRENLFSRTFQASSTASAGIELRVPLYQGGRPAAQVRQAQARRTQAMEQVFEAERVVIAQVRSAYGVWQSSQKVIASSEEGVAANRQSVEGVRAENYAGSRTMLDVLNASQELLSAEVTLITARRDAYVAAFALVAAMGRAGAQDLGLGVPLYDPLVNYDRVRGRISDYAADPEPAPSSTSTTGMPAQDATTTGVLGSPRP